MSSPDYELRNRLSRVATIAHRNYPYFGTVPFSLALFPVWQIPTGQLAAEMVASGLKAKAACFDPRVLPQEFVGRDFDPQVLANLPRRRPLRRKWLSSNFWP